MVSTPLEMFGSNVVKFFETLGEYGNITVVPHKLRNMVRKRMYIQGKILCLV